MSYNKPIRRIAIVGTGVIGASWAAEYLARTCEMFNLRLSVQFRVNNTAN